MTALGNIGKAAGIAIGALAGFAGAAALLAFRRPLPHTSGALKLPGLKAPVQVLRDRWGVPHIYAANNHDLFMAQGFVHAQDRLWQMEFQRRLGHGQFAEIFGTVALDSDRFLRILGLGRAARREADQLEGDVRATLQAYANGVNTYINQNSDRLPVEFLLLRIQPRPWQIADTLVWAKIMALQLSHNWQYEILRARLVAILGPERANVIDPRYPDDHPLTVPHGAHYNTHIGEKALNMAAAAERFAPTGDGQGSNAWVIGGTRSASGMPLLANDPHLAIGMPSIWYENHLSGGEYHVTGASFPGTPGVVIGHNEHIAWGVTNGMNDVQDLYIEKFDPQDPARYEFQGQWETAQIVREEIRVRGQDSPVIEEVRITRHGPVITPLISPDHATARNIPAEEETLALRWTALETGKIVHAILDLNRARNWETFRAALSNWDVPAQNVVYADVEGHYGYCLAGALPIRAAGDGRLPVPGWTGEYEWIGMIPHAELPHTLDPAEGFAITANNRIAGDQYPHYLAAEWASGYRAARIRQLIEQTPLHTAESFARIHGDQRSLPGLELAALAGRLPAPTVIARQARETLATWNGELTANSVGGMIYSRLRNHLLTTVYSEATDPLKRPIGIGAFASLTGQNYLERALPLIVRYAAERHDSWLPEGQTWDIVLGEAWAATLDELRSEFGDDISSWRYSRTHALSINHPLGVIPVLKRLFNRGPFPTGGDIDTVCIGNHPRTFAGAPYYVAPSYRQVCDPSDWDRSQSIHPTGQSGHPASKHYADFVQPWLNIQYHPMPWSRRRVEEVTAERLTLKP